MNTQVHIFLGLLLALLLGWTYQLPFGDSSVEDVPTASSVPLFQDLAGGWLVQVRFHRDNPPEILSVEYLETIRLGTSNPTGNYSIAVKDINNGNLFVEKFQVSFLRTGSATILEQTERTLVIPYFQTASQVLISAPQGEVSYDLTPK